MLEILKNSHPLTRMAAVCFVLGKIMFLFTLSAVAIDYTLAAIFLAIQSALILTAIVLPLIVHFSEKKKETKIQIEGHSFSLSEEELDKLKNYMYNIHGT